MIEGPGDVHFLEVLENSPNGFAPGGWLYESVMQRLQERGLVEGPPYKLSQAGRDALNEWRALNRRPVVQVIAEADAVFSDEGKERDGK